VDLERSIGRIDRNIFGHFIEHVGRCIYGGVYDPGSPRADARGFRTDVLAAMKRIGVPNLRWPGGNFASSYDWEDGIGPPNQRPARFDLAWRAVEPNTFGTDEFMAYCQQLGAAPYVCVNSSSGTLQEAAHWVEYCNLDAARYPTAYAQRRARNGHPEPYGVTYWGIGNEVYGAWQVGYSGADAYARKAREYAHFMRAVDPAVKLVAVGADIPEWDEAVLRIAGDTINYISNHQYHGQEDYIATVGAARYVEEHLHRLGEMIDRVMPTLRRTTPIQIAMDEWNVCDVAWGTSEKLPEPIEGEYFDLWEQTFSLKDALFAAGVFHAMFRECRHVTFANLAQMVNANGMLQTTPDGLLLTAIYHAFDVYANHTGAEALPTRVTAREGVVPSFTAEDWRYPEPRYVGLREPFLRFSYRDVSYLDAQATISLDRRTLFLSAINYHPTAAIDAAVDLGPTRARGSVAVVELNGADTHTPNTFERPNVTGVITHTVAEPVERYTFPAHSATVLQFHLEDS
jgi:alpha-N-arabinofuranosidase